MVIAADGLEQTGVRSAMCEAGRGELGDEPGANHAILDATPGHESVHLRRGRGGWREGSETVPGTRKKGRVPVTVRGWAKMDGD